jgi:hypothetical protein
MFVYVAGPILGALLGGVIYYKLIVTADKAEGVFAPTEKAGSDNAPPPSPAATTAVKSKK